MIALARMRLAAFVRTGRSLAPLLAALAILMIVYGGGQARAAEAYGFSALVLFPVLAWQSKLLLDVEPDTQRQLARVAVGGAGRETVAGLLAAVVAGAGTASIAMVLPWLVNAIMLGEGDSLAGSVGLGALAHLLAITAGVTLGALASRAVTRTVPVGLMVLVGGCLLTIVLGLRSSPMPWLVPPLMGLTRELSKVVDNRTAIDLPAVLATVGQGLLWTAIFVTGYVVLRRRRA
jgi:hypothetical protein